MKKNPLLKPVLKWVGGKRQLLDDILPMIPKNITTYVEPFIGGAAVLLSLQPKKAIMNDFNQELINVYNVVRDHPVELIEKLDIHSTLNNSDYFYKIRALDRDEKKYMEMSCTDKAARIIYLNKTCYNGLYRVNSAGHFNSPFGKYKNPNIADKTSINALSNYLNINNIQIKSGDYATALKGLGKGSFVYFDPPYMPISSSSSFTGYTENGFGVNEQIRLRDECNKLDKKGIKFLQSNSDCEFIRDLYKGYNFKTITAKRSVNSVGSGRGEINEILIYNYNHE